MKPLKKRTCLKCKKTKTEKHYKVMPNGRLNPKCNECRNQGRQPIERVNKKDDLIITNKTNSFEVVSTQRALALQALEVAKNKEKQLLKQGFNYKKTGIRAYILTN